jgi:hypothetical protein
MKMIWTLGRDASLSAATSAFAIVSLVKYWFSEERQHTAQPAPTRRPGQIVRVL